MDDGSEDDSRLFRNAMRGVQPLRQPPRAEERRRRRRARRAEPTDQLLGESLGMSAFEHLLETGDELVFCGADLSPRAFRRLRRGEYAVQAEIDLHGVSVARAREVLADFVAQCRRQGLRCVRVVHGKGLRSGPGGPVLKHEVDGWLRRWDSVLGFASAPPRDGGTGAVYVLLRRG